VSTPKTKKTTTRKKAAPKEKPSTKILVQRERISQKSITSKMTKMSADPFNLGNGSNNSAVVQVDFASEQGRRGKEIPGLGSGPMTTTISNATVARKRSRYAVLTNAYAKRSVDILVSNVVGCGQKLQANSPDVEFNKQIEELWADWSEEVDSAGKLNLAGFEALTFRSMLEGGDCFVRLRTRRPEDNLVVPLQLQLLEAEQVPTFKNEKNGNNAIIGGIEFTPFGSITRYHVFQSHPGEFATFQMQIQRSADTIPVDARQIIHIHDVRRPNEVRGLPILAQALIQLADLDAYMDAELVRKKCAALIGGFITYQPGMENLNPFITEQVNGEEADEQEDDIHIEALEPGTFPILPLGYDVRFSEPADVGINFKQFMRSQLLMLSASINILYEQLTGDYSSAGSDRTVRAAMLEFKRIAINYQKNIISHQFYRQVYKEFIRLAALSGELVFPTGMTLRQAQRAKWIPDPWEFLNPLQEVNTQIRQIRSGLVTRSEILTKMGKVPAEVDLKFREEKDREVEHQLIFDSNAEVVSSAGVVQSSDPDDILNDVEPEETTTNFPTGDNDEE